MIESVQNKKQSVLIREKDKMKMQKYLKECEYVDYSHKRVLALATNLARGCEDDVEIAKRCFTYVRDEIHHSGDYKDDITTYKASDVLKHGTGWCYAKSILLAALLRANGIPTAFCYQRLSCSEYVEDVYCLHGLNAIYLKEYGWYRVDARGNKEGVDAQFNPPYEKLAFELQENEYDLDELLSDPLPEVIEALKKYSCYEEMIHNFPDIEEKKRATKIKFYQVDAFAQKAFEGNPAAVCPLDEWLDEELMQRIAQENNLAETAFFIQNGDDFEIRWFTPTKEVNLCGHATLAAAHVIFNNMNYKGDSISFYSKSGELLVSREDALITMNFPSEPAEVCEIPQAILDAFELRPKEVLKSVDYIVVFEDGVDLQELHPNMEALKKLDLRGVCITTTHHEYDFVSRFFAPNYGIDEDSVTGSAYTQLTPYWAQRLEKKSFTSKQLSKRGGELSCRVDGERVFISGYGVCCIIGEMQIS